MQENLKSPFMTFIAAQAKVVDQRAIVSKPESFAPFWLTFVINTMLFSHFTLVIFVTAMVPPLSSFAFGFALHKLACDLLYIILLHQYCAG
jgi:hypothetical protein